MDCSDNSSIMHFLNDASLNSGLSDVSASPQHDPSTHINAIAASTSSTSQDEEDVCWICLSSSNPHQGALSVPCSCPKSRTTHDVCIAQWQLRNAGTSKEKRCSFCHSQLPDWRPILTPPDLIPRFSSNDLPATMNVAHQGVSRTFKVTPGAEGYLQFTTEIRDAFQLPPTAELNISFTCDNPTDPQSTIILQGPGAYDSAVHLARISSFRKSLDGPHLAVSSTALNSRWWSTDGGAEELRGTPSPRRGGRIDGGTEIGDQEAEQEDANMLIRGRIFYQRIRFLLFGV